MIDSREESAEYRRGWREALQAHDKTVGGFELVLAATWRRVEEGFREEAATLRSEAEDAREDPNELRDLIDHAAALIETAAKLAGRETQSSATKALRHAPTAAFGQA